MERVNNKNGIEMFWELNEDEKTVEILDSKRKFYKDIYYDHINEDNENDAQTIIHTLEQTTLQDMADYFDTKIYKSLNDLMANEEVAMEDLIDNEYINTFYVNENTFYVWSW